jgi:hypothetical protein
MKWPRYCEMLLRLSLLVVPWMINYGDSNTFRAVNIAAATVILLLDIVSITLYKPYAYLGVLVIAACLLVHAFFAMPPELAGTQNKIIVALLLPMFAILPTEATLPPPSWRKFHKEQRP